MQPKKPAGAMKHENGPGKASDTPHFPTNQRYPDMRLGIVFHKNPLAPPVRIDLIRLRAISLELTVRGATVEIIAPVEKSGRLADAVPVRPLGVLQEPSRYDLVKTCYHPSIELIGNYKGPVVSRLVRVVDEKWPARDEADRPALLRRQEMVFRRARGLILNNKANADRWQAIYGPKPPIYLIPNGCPPHLPALGEKPYATNRPVVLFLGSLAAPRMADLINELAERIHPLAAVHFIGRNVIHLYGGGREDNLSPLVVRHGEIGEPELWNYIAHANAGLALAASPQFFDNDLSKILYYLRAGLPVLSEERVLNNDLIRQTGYGRIFKFGNIEDLTANLWQLLEHPPAELGKRAVGLAAGRHSWKNRGMLFYKMAVGIINRTGNSST